jgi:hypothetical protein
MLGKIKAACAEGRVQWRNHSLERMMERGISRSPTGKENFDGRGRDSLISG